MRRNNNSLIAGIDEVGRGCIAGPVVAASVILNLKCIPGGLKDSKKISKKKQNKTLKQNQKNSFSVVYRLL